MRAITTLVRERSLGCLMMELPLFPSISEDQLARGLWSYCGKA